MAISSYRYFEFAGRPARVGYDETDFASILEIYERQANGLVCRNELLDDISDIAFAKQIGKDQFEIMLANLIKANSAA